MLGTAFAGPAFRLVEQVDWVTFARWRPRLASRTRPLLIKGALRHWPATDRWSFERLADLRGPDGSEVIAPFQIGIAEQGMSRADVEQPIASYLQVLGRAQREAIAEGHDRLGLLPAARHAVLSKNDTFYLD